MNITDLKNFNPSDIFSKIKDSLKSFAPEKITDKQPSGQAEKVFESSKKLGEKIREKISQSAPIKYLESQSEVAKSFKEKPLTFDELGKNLSNFALNTTINPLSRIGLSGEQTITGKDSGVGKGYGYDVDRSAFPMGMSDRDIIGSYQSIRDEIKKSGMSEFSADWRVALLGSFDIAMGYGLAKGGVPLAKEAIKQLPESLLMKAETQSITADEALNSLRGTNPSKKGNDFISSLSSEEKKALFNVAKTYEKSGVGGMPIERTTKKPNVLGEFAGLKEKEPFISQPGSKLELPGYREILPRGQAGFIGERPMERVGDPIPSEMTGLVPKTKIKPDLENLKDEITGIEATIDEHPAKQLSKYANKNGELPEVLGQQKSIFGTKGDDIVTELGFEDSEQARESYQQYRSLVNELTDAKQKLKTAKSQVDFDYSQTQLNKINKILQDPTNLIGKYLVGKYKEGYKIGVQETKLIEKAKAEEKTARLLTTERIKTLSRGVRMGTVSTKESVFETQKELNDIIKNSGLELNDKAKFLDTIKNIQTPEQLKKVIPEIRNRIVKLDEAETKRELLGKIKKELSENIYVGKGDNKISKYSPYVTSKLKEFRGELSFKNPESLKMKQLEITQQWVNDHPNETMPDDILESLDELKRTHLNLLSNAELEDQLQSIQSLKTQGKTFRKLKSEQIARERNEIINKIKSSITGGKGIKETGPVIESQKRGNYIQKAKERFKEYIDRNLIPDNIFDELDEKTGIGLYKGVAHEYFIPIINNSLNMRIQGTMDSLMEAQKELGKMGDLVKNLGDKVNFGDGITMTRNEMLDVYVSSHDPAKLESIVEGNKIPADKIEKIINSLIDKEKTFGDYLLNYYGESYDDINRVFRERHNFDMPKNESGNYVPMYKDMDFVGDEDINLVKQNIEYLKASVTKGFTKSRTGSLAPVKFDATGNFADFLSRTEHYKAYELPIQEMNSVLKGIKDAVVQEKGIGYYKILEDYIRQVANRGRYNKSYIEKEMIKLRGRTSAGLIGLNLVTGVKHALASIGGALSELPLTDYLKGVGNYSLHKTKWDSFWDSVPQFKERASSATREMEDISESKSPLRKLLGNKSLAEREMFMIRGMDKNVVRSEATAVYLKSKNEGASEQEAISQAESKLRRTQTGGAVEHMPDLMRGGSWQKMFTLFMSEKNKYFNLIYAYSRGYQQGRVTFSSLARVLFYAWVFNGVAMEEAKSGGTAKPIDLLKAIAVSPLEDLLVLGSIIESVRSGYSYEAAPVFSLVSDLVKHANSIATAKKSATKFNAVKGLAEDFASLGGVSIKPLERTGQGIIDLYKGKTKDWRRLIWSDAALGETKTSTAKPKYGKIKGINNLPSLKMPSLKMPSLNIK